MNGSILGQQDLPMNDLGPAAVDELAKNIPFLFKVLATASSTTANRQYGFLSVIYAMLMRQRSERMNNMQKGLTAMLLRYQGGNQVRNK